MFSWFELEGTLLKQRTCVLMPNSSSWDHWFPSALAQCSVTGRPTYSTTNLDRASPPTIPPNSPMDNVMITFTVPMKMAQVLDIAWPKSRASIEFETDSNSSLFNPGSKQLVPAKATPNVWSTHMSNTLLFQGLAFKIAFPANQLPQESKTHDCHRKSKTNDHKGLPPKRASWLDSSPQFGFNQQLLQWGSHPQVHFKVTFNHTWSKSLAQIWGAFADFPSLQDSNIVFFWIAEALCFQICKISCDG